MTTLPQIVLFGVRSPMIADFEETCERAGLTIVAAVKASAARARDCWIAGPLVEPAALTAAQRAVRCVVCAFSPMRRRELVDGGAGRRPALRRSAGRPDRR